MLVSIYNWGLGGSFGYFSRYIFYIALIFLLLNNKERISEKYILYILLLMVVISGIAGIVTSRYIFLNGYDRALGLTSSPVGLALACTICHLYYIHLKMNSGISDNLFLLILLVTTTYILIETGARQPLAGLLVIYAYFLFKKLKFKSIVLVSSVLLISGAYMFLYYFDEIMTSSRAIYQLSLIITSPETALNDPSSLSRLNYIVSVLKFYETYNYLLPAGFNAFSVIYEEQGYRPNTAFHNDILLPALEYGVVLATVNLIALTSLMVKNKGRVKDVAILGFLVCTSLNNTFYYNLVSVTFIFMLFLRNNDAIYVKQYIKKQK